MEDRRSAGTKEELVAADTADGTVLWRTAVVDEDCDNAIPSPAATAETAYVDSVAVSRE